MHIDFFCFLDRADLWASIAELARERGRQGGVYRIHAFREDAPREWCMENLVTVNRASEPDPLGRLFIGSTEVMAAGFITLWRSLGQAQGAKAAEGAGRAYRDSLVLRRRFPRLCFTLRFSPSPAETQAEELAGYFACFGELPPLNATLAGERGRAMPAASPPSPLAAIA